MFNHLFKLIWNKKKQNFLLMLEMLISFLVLFAVFTLVVYYYQNYKKPLGIDYSNVWVINYNNSLKTENSDSLVMFYETLRKSVKSLPHVMEVSFSSSNIPFSQNTTQNSITYNGKQFSDINDYKAEDSYLEVLNMQLLSGRWFSREDDVFKDRPIVINNSLKELLFGEEDAIGKFTGTTGDRQKIIGVVEDVKFKGDYSVAGRAVYNRLDTSAFRWLEKILVKVSPGATPVFEERLYRTVAGHMKNANVEIEHLSDKRKNINYFLLVPMIILLIVAGFLIINVALGIFGVLWYNINKRKGEIGLRRAVGATGKSVAVQLVTESVILATLSLVIGIFFAIQFPLLNVFDLPSGIYLSGIFLSVLFIYLLVLICSFYPGKQAAAIYPAAALHEE